VQFLIDSLVCCSLSCLRDNTNWHGIVLVDRLANSKHYYCQVARVTLPARKLQLKENVHEDKQEIL
jgi:hypothetical protein